MSRRTLGAPVEFAGVGLHSGTEASLRCLPAQAGSGIVFVRVDRPGSAPVRATVDAVVDTARAVTVGSDQPVRTVEHLLAAAAVLGISDLRVEVGGEEIPALDGSAAPFADAMRRAGLVDLDALDPPLKLANPVWVAAGEASLLALPAPALRLTYVVHLRSALGTQVVDVDPGGLPGLLPARTWGYADELEALRAAGQARGAGSENAVAIGPHGYLTPPRTPDEPVRHKALDLVGDLCLLGRPLQAHVVAVSAGHRLHVELVRRIMETEAREP